MAVTQTKKFDLNIEIARHICMAQEYSELGKQYIPYCLREIKDEYYSKKREHIEKAISLMNHNTHPEWCQFTYYIDECMMQWDHCDQIGQIVYFTYRGNGGRFQISFHVPPPERRRSRSFKGLNTKWDHKNSHYSCEVLKKIFNLKYEIHRYW